MSDRLQTRRLLGTKFMPRSGHVPRVPLFPTSMRASQRALPTDQLPQPPFAGPNGQARRLLQPEQLVQVQRGVRARRLGIVAENSAPCAYDVEELRRDVDSYVARAKRLCETLAALLSPDGMAMASLNTVLGRLMPSSACPLASDVLLPVNWMRVIIDRERMHCDRRKSTFSLLTLNLRLGTCGRCRGSLARCASTETNRRHGPSRAVSRRRRAAGYRGRGRVEGGWRSV